MLIFLPFTGKHYILALNYYIESLKPLGVFSSSIYNYSTVYNAHGFDTCSASSVSQMQTWWSNSPYSWMNVYIGGINRACSQGNLNTAWMQSIHQQNWALVPTWVGLQPPCSYAGAMMSTNGSTAYNQGVQEAQGAISASQNLGIYPSSIIYVDLEYYQCSSGQSTADNAVANFVNGWDSTLNGSRFKSGVYISGHNVQSLCNYFPYISQPNDGWLAYSDGNAYNVYGIPPSGCWTNYSDRLKQYNTSSSARLVGGEKYLLR